MTVLERTTTTLVERAQVLESTDWLHDLEWKQIEKLADYMQLYTVKTGIVLFEEAARESYMGIIVKGAVKVLKQGPRGKRKQIAVLGAGKTFGEMSLIDDQPRSATIETTQPLSLLVLNKEELDRLEQEFPRLAFIVLVKLARMMSSRLRQTSGKLTEFLDALK